MKTYEIESLIENYAPKRLAYPWDNVGLLLGDSDKEIKKALITLDTNLFVAKEAVRKNADIIISHHPILLGGIKRIDYKTVTGQMLKILIENNIPVIAAHTNMDTAKGGINDALANLFSLRNVKIIDIHTSDETAGLGRIGEISEKVSLKDFASFVKSKLNTPFVRISGNDNAMIKTVAVASGSCSEIIPIAKSMGADVIITGDMKYHNTIDNVETGINIIDAGHYPTEIIVMDIFNEILKNSGIETVKSENKDIFRVL